MMWANMQVGWFDTIEELSLQIRDQAACERLTEQAGFFFLSFLLLPVLRLYATRWVMTDLGASRCKDMQILSKFPKENGRRRFR